MVTNLALEEEGAQVTGATSYDPRFPAENVLNEEEGSFWVTTGTYPQEFILQLSQASLISRIKTSTRNVKLMVIEKCDTANPVSWEKILELDMKENDGGLQLEDNQLQRVTATFLKFKIFAGWDDFSTVHRISVEGRSARE